MGRGSPGLQSTGLQRVWIRLKRFSMQARLAWGAWKEEQVGCQTPFASSNYIRVIVSVCLEGEGVGGGNLQNSFVQSNGKLGDNLWLKCGWRSAWNLLWCGGTMTWLVSGPWQPACPGWTAHNPK